MALPAPSWCDDPSLRPAPLAFKRRAPTVVVSSEPPSPPIPPAPPLPPNEDQIAHWSDECREHLSTLRAWVPRLETVLEDEEGESSDLSFSSSIDEGREIPSDVPSSFDVGDDDNDDSDRLTVVSSVDSGPSASGGANSSSSVAAKSKSGDLVQALALGSRSGGGQVR
ncbi:MAG: hypothetical protein M1812_003559 [Candelaria pacifica]|nr:MAG: hypothetical protein M1812_003559 [Candelaria pacifica]